MGNGQTLGWRLQAQARGAGRFGFGHRRARQMTPRVWGITLWSLALFCLAMALVMLSRPASAQAACGPLVELLAALRDKAKEFVVATATVGNERVFFTVSETGDFTVIITRQGAACIVLAGKGYESDRGI